MLRISASDVKVGQPLTWDCYDTHGVLLLRRGSVVSSDRQLEGLISRGLFVNAAGIQEKVKPKEQAAPQIISAFHIVDDLKLRLKGILDAIAKPQNGDLQARVIKLCQDLQALCDMDADAALGSLHLDHEGRYTVIHPLHVALLAELIGRKKNLSVEDRQTMLAAAMTANVAMNDLQEVLHKQQTPLTDAQKEAIRLHPLQGVEMLLDAGIKDDVWIKSVLHHHEKLDGSGYPGALKGDGIPLQVRILSLADTYSAMITPRVYRGQILAKEALRDIFLKRGSEVDGELAGLFIKELGVFPPGAFVKLQNGESAVVIKRGANPTCPEVCSVIGPRGAPLSPTIKRDTSDANYVIREMVPRDNIVRLDLHKLWGYR
jgi:HD-GYP domain-containing protein (c-di-GMP phosphodiesterase class II)